MWVLAWTPKHTELPQFAKDIGLPKDCILLRPTDERGSPISNKSHCVVHLSELVSHVKLHVGEAGPDLWRVTFLKYHEPDGWQNLGRQI